MGTLDSIIQEICQDVDSNVLQATSKHANEIVQSYNQQSEQVIHGLGVLKMIAWDRQ